MSRSSLSSLDTINMIGNTMASLDQLIEDSWTDSIALDMLFDEDSTNIIVTNAPPRRRTLSRCRGESLHRRCPRGPEAAKGRGGMVGTEAAERSATAQCGRRSR